MRWKFIFTISSVTTSTMGVSSSDIDSSNELQDCYEDGALLINLTQTFGAGKEPSKA